MYTLLILAVLTSTTLTGILSATHPALLSATGLPANSSRGETMDHQPRPSEREPVQKVVRRRSINIPDPDKPKVNRLLKVNRNRFLEVTQDGHVVTTTSSNSVYSKLEVQFMCQLFPERFRPCSPWQVHRPRLPDQTEGVADDEDQRSTYSAVLLRFTETNRYLCIDESANIYTKPDDSANRDSLDISDCVFQHDFLPNQYDVYSSHKYPRNTSRCLRANPGRARPVGGKGRYCDKRWFIGVNRKADVLTVKSSRTPSQKAFFIQRWVHDQPSQTSPQFNVNPYREAKHTGNNSNSSSGSSSSSTKRPERDTVSRQPAKNKTSPPSSVGPHRVKSRRPVYRFLTRPSSALFRRRNRGKGHKKAACGNLLKNCDDDEDAKEEEEVVRHDEERQLFAHRSPKKRREHKRKTTT